MTFEYRDDASCDKLVAQPDTDDNRKPVVFISTTGFNNGVYVPVDRVEEVVAGIRDAARTASGQQPETTVCAHCGLEVENRGEPSMDGNHHVLWVHVPGGYSVCFPQQSASSPRATPAVGQPAEAQATDEAHPADVTWTIEKRGDTDWLQASSHHDDREKAISRLANRREQFPLNEFRLVRETTTWTVEDER